MCTDKYRCPRCSALTCSLPCVKRHKQWAQCNGTRDPTKYIKQKDLATPKGIDHDYNYLTSIERELDHADKNATSRGIVLEEAARRKGYIEKGEVNLKKAIEACGVIVVKAPKGMSRNKQNNTQVTKKYVRYSVDSVVNPRHALLMSQHNRTRTLRWTVEWIHPDGSKGLGMCSETEPIGSAYILHLDSLDSGHTSKRGKPNPKSNTTPDANPREATVPHQSASETSPTAFPAAGDSLDEDSEALREGTDNGVAASENPSQSASKKRNVRRKAHKKRQYDASHVDTNTQEQVSEAVKETAEDAGNGAAASEASAQSATQKRNARRQALKKRLHAASHVNTEIQGQLSKWKQELTDERKLTNQHAEQPSTADEDKSESNIIESASVSAPTCAQPPHAQISSEAAPDQSFSFYLHHPSLPSKDPVLIPLPPDSRLLTALTNRLVLEFPTIFVFQQQPETVLPEGFISEDEFFATARTESVEEMGEAGDLAANYTDDKVKTGVGLEEGEVDERRLIEVLGKDLGGTTGSL